MIEIKYDDALSALNDAIVEKGSDFVYVKEVEVYEDEDSYKVCTYVHPDEEGSLTVPGCLVGNVMARLGVPIEAMAAINNDGFSARVLFSYLSSRNIISITEKAASLLVNAQCQQDNEFTWGESVFTAVSRVHTLNWSEDEEIMAPK